MNEQNKITLDDIRKAVKLLEVEAQPLCQGKHDYSKTNFCIHCNKIWCSKEDLNKIKEVFKV